jgi:hypothetical protein
MAASNQTGCYMKGRKTTNFVEDDLLERKRKSA